MKSSELNALFTHQQYAQDLSDPCETTRVQLYDIQSISLQELFEHHAVVSVFASCNTDPKGLEGSAHSSVSENIIRRCWLFDKPKSVRN